MVLILIIEQYVVPAAGNMTIVVKQSKNTNFHPDTGLPLFVGQTVFVPNDTANKQENKITSIDYDKDDKHCS